MIRIFRKTTAAFLFLFDLLRTLWFTSLNWYIALISVIRNTWIRITIWTIIFNLIFILGFYLFWFVQVLLIPNLCLINLLVIFILSKLLFLMNILDFNIFMFRFENWIIRIHFILWRLFLIWLNIIARLFRCNFKKINNLILRVFRSDKLFHLLAFKLNNDLISWNLFIFTYCNVFIYFSCLLFIFFLF